MDNEIQHAIPQQISSYQFRLVGDMTLQQFFQVAIGAIIALVIYSSGLPGYIKWPLVLLSFLTGVAFAFFPLQDRPLQKWVVLFFKSIYSPTLYVWKEDTDMPDFFQKEEISLPQTADQKINQQKPMQSMDSSQSTIQTTMAQSDQSDTIIDQLATDEKTEVPAQISIPKPTDNQRPNDPIMQTEKSSQQKETPKRIEVPKTQDIQLEKHKEEEKSKAVEPASETSSDASPLKEESTFASAKNAQFNQDVGPPTPPNKPNVVVGQVLGPNGEIVENAILEIKDKEGRPVRALKSNRLGHFMIVTPLSNGEYEIITEKEELEFDTIKIEATGSIIPPIAIWATGANNSSSQQESDKNNTNKINETNNSDSQNNQTKGTIYTQENKQQ